MKKIKFSEEQAAEICRLYVEEAYGADNIGKIFSVGGSPIRRILKENNIKANKIKTKYEVVLGNEYGRLTIIKEEERDDRRRRQVSAQCSCDGNIRLYNWLCVARGDTKSCGCYNQEKRSERAKARAKNVIGKKYNRMTILEETEKQNGMRYVIAECECGKIKKCQLSHIRSGNIKSCGCWSIEELKSRDRTEQANKRRYSADDYKKLHPFFYEVEEIRDSEYGGIEVKCKLFSCQKWFKPTHTQIRKRIDALDGKKGNGESNLYCSENCKHVCPLYNLNSNSIIYNNLYRTTIENKFTVNELSIFSQEVRHRQFLEFGYNFCEYGDCKNEGPYHVHHERPKSVEWIFGLDPDNGIVFCEEHHYSIGHSGECSTGALAYNKCKKG